MSLLARINFWLTIVAALALAVIVLITTVDVLSANFRGRPLTGIYELVEAALIYIVFLGIPETFRAERNITVDVIDHFVSTQSIAYLRGIAAVVEVAFLGLMGWSMLGPALDALRFGDMKSDTGLPLWVMWAPALLGTLLAIIAAASVMIRVLRARGHSTQPDSGAVHL